MFLTSVYKTARVPDSADTNAAKAPKTMHKKDTKEQVKYHQFYMWLHMIYTQINIVV